MAQRAKPDPVSLSTFDNRGPQKSPPGNPRMGPGQGGTDQAVDARPGYPPRFEGMSRAEDGRIRPGTVDDSA
jgi:hypothetical protein